MRLINISTKRKKEAKKEKPLTIHLIL